VTLDHITGKCAGYGGKYYASVIVPKPDTIRPLAPVNAKVYDPDPVMKDCKKPPLDRSLYGTSSELIYESVNLSNLKLQQGATSWNLQVDEEDGFLTIYLRPMHPDDLDHTRAFESYAEMLNMVGANRCFTDPELTYLSIQGADKGGRAIKSKNPSKRTGHKQVGILSGHSDCHAPQLLVCKNAGCK
jgi:hypothetical protein